jgi:catechol 2,3-dioxygenase-like lactoylglutathione lyase family enzyme
VPLHHVELWVADLGVAAPRWDWLFTTLGWTPFQEWATGRSWRDGDAYVVVEQSPHVAPGAHDRRRPGLNHLALTAPSRAALDALVAAGSSHGWTLLFPDRHPWAGGTGHYAAYLEEPDGFEVEVVALGD